MASSSSSEPGSNDDKVFSERVKKTFGSLFASLQPSPASLSNPLWSLTGADVQKKEWRRDKDTSARDSTPCSSSFDHFFSQARKSHLRDYQKELDDQDDLRDLEHNRDDQNKDRDFNDSDVRASIGLDSTLDHEEEEDTYDKVATGRENAGDRLYMRDVIDSHDTDIRSEDDIPGAAGNRLRDPRANLFAAKIRLKEDDAEAAAKTGLPKPEQAPPQEDVKEATQAEEQGDKLKPILKRKEHEPTTSKPAKRVRFDPGCISASERVREVAGDVAPAKVVTQDNGSMEDEKVARVPDYVQNPSKYTCYSLESVDEMNDKSNAGAFMDFLEMVKRARNGGSGLEQTDAAVELPKSVTFVPKKKSDTTKSDNVDSTTLDKQTDTKHPKQSTTIGVSAEEEENTDVGDMEIDELEATVELDRGSAFKKQGRQYRSKSRSEEEA